MGDLLNPALFRARLKDRLVEINDIFRAHGWEEISDRKLADEMLEATESLLPMITDTVAIVQKALSDRSGILLEGAQGTLLDIDMGTYPFVTSSNTTSAGACSGAGLPPHRIDDVIGVMKAYTTRVGEGPMVTEMEGEEEEELQRLGGEFGVVTGRGRRCGWLDLVQAEHSTRLSGFTSIAITKIDVLCGYKEVKVCTAYEIDGDVIRHFPASLSKIEAAKPVYKTMKGWEGWNDTAEVVRNGYEALPEEMRSYISLIEESLKVPVDIVSVGPGREETIVRRNPWHS